MADPILIDVPSVWSVGDVVMSMERVSAISVSPFTKEEQIAEWPGEQWIINFNLNLMTEREIASQWIAFGLKLKGRRNRFLFGDPSGKKPQGVATGTPVVDGANQVGDVLATTGWTPSVTGILKVGDYIQIGTGMSARLKFVTDDVSSDASGNALIPIASSLNSLTSPLDGASIITNNPRGVFRLVDDTWSWNATPERYDVSFRAVEVVNA